MKKLVITLLLMIGFTNLAFAEDCDANHQLTFDTEVSLVSHDQDSDSQNTNDCSGDCCTHQCHFGHCAFVLEENPFSFVPGSHYGSFFRASNIRSTYPNNLFRPPIV